MKASILTLILVAVVRCSGQEVLYTLEGPFTQKDVLIPQNEFSKASALKLADAFLQESTSARAAKLTIYTDKATTFLLRSGKGVTDYSYTLWLFEYNDLLPKISAMAELIRIGDRAAIRIRNMSGEIEEVDLRGHNLFHGQVGGLDYDLLEITFRKTLPNAGTPTISMSCNVTLKQTLSPDAAQSVARFFQGEIGMPNFHLVIRNDSWFIDDQAYPWINPFVPLAQPPQWNQYKDSFGYSCRSVSHHLECVRVSMLVQEGENH